MTVLIPMNSILNNTMATNNYYNNSSTSSSRMRSIYRMSELAEKFRPVSVNGEEVLNDSYNSGNLNLVSGENIDISVENGSIKISAKTPEIPDIPDQQPDTVRPIYVNGEEILNNTVYSGELNLVGGKNVSLSVEGNSVIISAKSGGEGGNCDCPEVVEGEGIDIVETAYGQKIVSLEKGAITDEYIDSISVNKLVQEQGFTLRLNGGNANG